MQGVNELEGATTADEAALVSRWRAQWERLPEAAPPPAEATLTRSR